ncbi:DUF664 domain-containing protein [Elioraea sp. Yellowstone]|jgi:uncharacterized damage-inducible protein DinB|uniref:DinB family protein n=1 Tax=Elioraea sp. Yellowstone TaxID=2592070 RepID=UPI001154D193|nr:DinB family protein [Elioraea sp. Yellowstone]TQF82024.1 DUF664 domain-containing protein [Elioraea sp. Yellowstone]
MITPAWCRLMAAYNSEMNRRIYAAAAEIPDEARKRHAGAFFGSLHATLNHLLWADRLWMSRLAGWERPRGGIAGSTALYDDFDALRSARVEADAGIESWAVTLTDEALAGDLTWFSGATQREWRAKRWIVLVHLFNHQTHHRGQAHCLITQHGVTPADTDLPFILDLAALGLT